MNKYYSQHKQDEILDQIIFKGQEKGFFLDIGANDGVTYSNTFFLEKFRSWNGICVEPLPSTFEKLKTNRLCILENCAAGAKTGKDVLLEISGYSEMLSGLKKNYNKKHIERIDTELKEYGGEKHEIEINCVNINDLLLNHNAYEIDYCNIDTEGSELEIIKAINFNKFKINVFTVEANYGIDQIHLKFLLSLKGYRYVESLGNDMIFIHKRLLGKLGKLSEIKRQVNFLNNA